MALVKPLYLASGKYREASDTADTVRFNGIGLGIAPNANSWVTTAASTASKGAYLMTPGVQYTGTVNGMQWYETTNQRKRMIKNTTAVDFITSTNNHTLKGTPAKSVVTADGTTGDLGLNEVINLFVTDSDIITAINSATFSQVKLATITPANSKVIYQGQEYYNSTQNIYYRAIADNQVYILSGDIGVDSTGKKWRNTYSTSGVLTTTAV